MEWVRLGQSGLKVSRLCLGTMMFGSRMDEAQSHRMLDAALDLGIGFLDTGDVYPFPPAQPTWGLTEQILGSWIRRRREQVVIATKCANRSGTGPNDSGGSRRHIIEACEQSLRRLGVDCIDLYYLHHSRTDAPVQETMSALDSLVRSGKVHYIGLSNFSAWQLALADEAVLAGGLTPIAAISPQLSLLRRSAERDLLPLAEARGIAAVPYYALAGGLLSGRVERQATLPAQHRVLRAGFDEVKDAAQVFDVCESVSRLAEELGCSPSQLALAWAMSRPGVVSSVIGASSVEQLEQSVAALEMALPAEIVQELDGISAAFA